MKDSGKGVSNIASHISTVEELANVLNVILGGFVNKTAENISVSELKMYSDVNNNERYTKFRIPKKNKNFYRLIFAPENRLKDILRCVNILLQSLYLPKEFVTGFVHDCSVVQNATMHKSKNYVYNIDLKDFFFSIDTTTIVQQLQKVPYFYSKEVAIVIANLSSVIHKKTHAAVLSQGSPASPILSNIVCGAMDDELHALSLFYKLGYSRYADDITFSSDEDVFRQSNTLYGDIEKIITSNGFYINNRKKRLQTKNTRQVVTGLIVNEKVNVSRQYIKDIRNLLYIWKRYGARKAQKSYDKKIKKLGKQTGTLFINSLRGKLSYLSFVRGKDDIVYLRFRLQYDRLLKEYRRKQQQRFRLRTYCYI